MVRIGTAAVRPAEFGDIPEVLADIRGFERVEVTREMLWQSLEQSQQSWAALVDGKVMALWGFMLPSMTEPVVIWAATTSVVEDNKLTFMRIFKRFVGRLAREYGPIAGVLDCGAPHRWLEAAGFDVEPAGPDGLRRFVKWH